jgi:hypothetical protein
MYSASIVDKEMELFFLLSHATNESPIEITKTTNRGGGESVVIVL